MTLEKAVIAMFLCGTSWTMLLHHVITQAKKDILKKLDELKKPSS